MERVLSPANLRRAYRRVVNNRGAPGADGLSVDELAGYLKQYWPSLRERLQTGEYQPYGVRAVNIPKPDGGVRTLGIPSVLDRLIQQALLQQLTPLFEPLFSDFSYGFRPGRSAHQAIEMARAHVAAGYRWSVELDLEKFFDRVDHDLLMDLLARQVEDPRVRRLVRRYLEAGVMAGGLVSLRREGTPQGGVISPLLANIYLNPLDWQMKNRGVEMVRYADDIVILCPDLQSAQQALGDVQKWAGENGLTLHPEKTRVVDMTISGSYFDFLGYRFWKSRKGNIRRLVRPKSMRKLRQTIKPLTRRANGHSMAALTKKLTPILRGWHNYFKQADLAKLREVDGWVRGRIRGILRKRSGLRGLSRGADHQRWPNTYFAALGLFCLEEAHRAELTSLRNGATC